MRITTIGGLDFTIDDEPDFIPLVYFEAAARSHAEWCRQGMRDTACGAWSQGQPVSAYVYR